MLRGLGHTDPEFTHEVLGLSIDMDKDDKNRLAAGSREGEKTPRGVANQSEVKGQMTSASIIGPLSDTFVLPINFQDLSWSEEAKRRYDEAIPMESPQIKTKPMLGDGFVGGCLSSY